MEKEELCPKCKIAYLNPTDDARQIICHFCGTSQLHLNLDYVDCRGYLCVMHPWMTGSIEVE
jgi:hypothetical protein